MSQADISLNQSSLPKVSVIMNCLNSDKYLSLAIDSVYAQVYKDWEIVFWDNCSTDNSSKIAKSYDEKLKYFRGEKTVPLGEARNQALKQAKGEYIAFLDCDDLWLPQKLKGQIPILENNSKTGVVFSNSITFNGQGWSRLIYGKKYPPTGKVFKELLGNYFLSIDTVIFRKKVLDTLDEWFDPRFHMVEEAELLLRIAYQGWEFSYVCESLSKWRMHQGSSSFSKPELYPKEKEMVIDKFCDKFDDFQGKFKKEIGLLRAKIHYEYAMLSYKEGGSVEVRKKIGPYLFITKRCFLLYFFSYFPYKLYKKFSGFFKKKNLR